MDQNQTHAVYAAPPAADPAKTDRLRGLAESTSVSEIMSRSVVCLAPDTRVESVSRMFLERGISSAPVVDENWHPIGMISKTDLLRSIMEAGGVQQEAPTGNSGDALPEHGEGHARVRDITMPQVLSLHEEAPVSVAAALMAYEGVHRLPIVASSGEVVGVVSTLDIIRWVARTTDLDVTGEAAAR